MSSFSEKPHLKAIFVKSFRNLMENALTFGGGHHLFLGPNGYGKTNCLEAIAMACSLKPMQTLKNNDLINFAGSQARIVADFNNHHHLEIDIFPQGKKVKKNGQPLRKTSEITSSFSLVTFIPEELMMVSHGANLRRRALDHAAISIFFEHGAFLKAYEKILLHRNRLLKEWPIDFTTLAVFTDMLIKEGAHLIFSRQKTLDALQEVFDEKIKLILGPHHSGSLCYLLDEKPEENLTLGDILATLKNHHAHVEQIERKRRVTLFGPHLDDILFCLDGIDAKKTASRGQSRAIVLAFKLAQMAAIQEIRGIAPIIILDDIISELDPPRKINLLKTIRSLNTQAFFTATDKETFGTAIDCDIFLVDQGTVRAQK